MDRKFRSFIKGITWRVVATCNGVLVAFILTGDFTKGLKIGVVGNITGFILFYLHERLWNQIRWGVRTAVTKRKSM